MTGNTHDIRVRNCRLYEIPIETRVPLKFGNATLDRVVCARTCLTVERRDGRRVEGWGETPLSVQWVWPSELPYAERERALVELTRRLAAEWAAGSDWGHPMEIGHDFFERRLPSVISLYNESERAGREPVPHLGGLVCASLFDIACHDAYGVANDVATYETYTSEYMNRDLSYFFSDSPPRVAARKGRLDEAALGEEGRPGEPKSGARRRTVTRAVSRGANVHGSEAGVDFTGRFPADFLEPPDGSKIPAWHLVGGKDRVSPDELDGSEPQDGYPVLLADWIARDGLKCLKVKLTGTDAEWDLRRLCTVGRIGIAGGVDWLTADFNCQVEEPAFVNRILDRLKDREPRIYGMILYVEQPFPYDLAANPINVHSVSARKPLFMDESAHDWRVVRDGFSLGWTGVALKTCKTQTGALLSLCWAKAHGMTLMVQDLTNPMLAQIPHLQLGYYAGTIMGVETNGMQFYPEASRAEAAVHPGAYTRRDGAVDLSSCLGRSGFGYRIEEIDRVLPEPVAIDTSQ